MSVNGLAALVPDHFYFSISRLAKEPLEIFGQCPGDARQLQVFFDVLAAAHACERGRDARR